MDIDDVNRAETLLDGLQYLPDWGSRVLAVARALAGERAGRDAAFAVAVSDLEVAEAKLEKVAAIVQDLDLVPGARMIAQMLDNVLFPCDCPAEHCGECGCCP